LCLWWLDLWVWKGYMFQESMTLANSSPPQVARSALQ
jgi:hypothetical protein